ncbi:T9SS type B sorting domain-containing protein [Flavivirga aquatica]|nr:T9SS type B sorting domain-containing protein [Flavivirga aquatica]
MRKINCPKVLFIVTLILFSLKGFSQLSRTHYIPPLTNADPAIPGGSIPQDQHMYISTPSVNNVTYTIIAVGQSTPLSTGVVSNATPLSIPLDTGNGQLFIPAIETSVVTNNRGYIIEASEPIYVSIRVNAGAQAGAFVSKGLSGLGTTFRVGAYTNESGRTPGSSGISDNLLSFVSVMATEDMTAVSFSDISNNTEVVNFSGTFPLNNIILNKGESYTIAMNSYSRRFSETNKDGLIGALVQSDKAIAVNCGSANGSFVKDDGRDYGFDQIVDFSNVGNEYIFVKGDGLNSFENVLIVAHLDNTQIRVNGNAAPIATINAGEYYVIEGLEYTAENNMYVQTSENVFAYQGVGGPNRAGSNQGMFFVPPLSCEASGDLDNIADITHIGSKNYTGGITIVSNGTVTISSASGNIPTGSGDTVTGKPGYMTYRVDGITGDITVRSTGELYCAYVNFNAQATSGSFYSGFPSRPEVNFNFGVTSLGICIPNVILEIDNAADFTNGIQWAIDTGSGFSDIPGANSATFTPTTPGIYQVTGTLCTGRDLKSQEISISDCPGDTDNDGVNDNIDIDIDNDGILNCVESLGNQIIDLSTPTSGNLAVGGYTFTGNVTASTNNSATTPFSGMADGTFSSDTSIFDATNESSTTYNLNFNSPLNLLLEYPTNGSVLLTSDDEIIIQVPNNKTVTLLDPDDQLLVDTDFDGVYETGVTQVTAFEIRFKLNGASLAIGTGTFTFSSHAVDNFTYKHINKSVTSASQASFKITATCLPRDSDGDGIDDSLDLDSDNDGIPDIIESLGPNNVTPSGIINSQGYDTNFNMSALQIDTDSDGVPDFLDLDSDNDGIYDVQESGSGLPDTNFDGIIDNIIATMGTNGWDNNAETAIDSGLIGYTINNADSDSLFTYIDLDSDADGCSDTTEANFSDGNNDDLLGDNIPTVDILGKVNNATDGYTGAPNDDYITAAISITITSQPVNDNICTSSNTSFTVASNADAFQWEVSSDNGTSWTTLTNSVVDGATYSDVTTNTLSVSNTPNSFNNYQYRVLLNITGNTCGGIYTNTATLTVNPFISLPSSLSPLELCDGSNNDGTENFDLTSKNQDILGTPIPAAYTVTYYTDPSRNTPFEISNITSYSSTGETIYVTVTGPSGCPPNTNLQFDLIVNPFPSTGIVANYELCDDDTDGIQTFVLDFLDATILGTQSPTDYAVKYYLASDGSEITNTVSYENRTPNSEAIIARVIGPGGCFGDDIPFDLIVHPLPNISTNLRINVCDGDAGDDSTDGIYPFDTSSLESDILNGTNPANVTTYYTYTNSSGIFVNDATSLPNPLVTSSQTITVRVESNTLANSISGQACYSQIDIPFIVSVQPVANPIAPIEVCDGDAGDDDADGMYPFNTSTFEDDILNGQTSMIVYYTYIDESGSQVTKSRFLPDPLRSGTQTILVEVENFTNPNCSDTTNIDLTVNLLPGFTISAQTPICNSTPGSVVTLDPEEDNLTEVYTYQWVNLANPSTVLATTNTYDASIAGTYNVTLTKTDGTGCSRSRDVEVIESEIATITIANVEINDTSENNSVKIIDETTLGIGDYEYALEEESLTINDESTFDYQDDSSFYNVRAGFYNLWIRDRNGCGTSTPLHIAVVGYIKYFTPNGDNQNDYWQIQGVNDLIKPSSNILIYDRYGKLLKQVDPLGLGWDGTLNGKMLPADDYWFRVHLLDGTSFMGHFTLKR